MRHLFTSYLGAVYASQGMVVVQNWVGALVDPEYEPMETDTDQPNYPKKVKTEAFSPPPSAFSAYAHAVPPEPVSMPPPPPPANPPPPLPNPMTPAQPSTAFLPMFNQTANQRRVFVEYPAQFSGPPHAGRWTVKCVGKWLRNSDQCVVTTQRYITVNGIEKGAGSGASKQLAKEEAAKQAWYAMGWAARKFSVPHCSHGLLTLLPRCLIIFYTTRNLLSPRNFDLICTFVFWHDAKEGVVVGLFGYDADLRIVIHGFIFA